MVEIINGVKNIKKLNIGKGLKSTPIVNKASGLKSTPIVNKKVGKVKKKNRKRIKNIRMKKNIII